MTVQQYARAVEIGQQIMSQALQTEVRLQEVEPLGGSDRSHVIRCRVLTASDNAPGSVVVKQALARPDESYDPDSPDGPAVRFFNEWAGLQFLGECFGDDSPVPRFY